MNNFSNDNSSVTSHWKANGGKDKTRFQDPFFSTNFTSFLKGLSARLILKKKPENFEHKKNAKAVDVTRRNAQV